MRAACYILFFIPFSLCAQGPVLVWEKTSHDFGDVAPGTKVEFAFRFYNRGNQPLFITNIETGCGCTTPKGWPRDPVKPGDRGEIIVAFNSTGKKGKQIKVVRVVSNAVNEDAAQLTIHANVLPNPLNPQ